MTIRKIIVIPLLLLLALFTAQSVMSAEIERTATVASVHDGDTFTLTTGEKVRLADLNAPELGDTGADEATDYLRSLVNQKTVYLDVDDKYETDSFGRLVCVVYVSHNSTHYLNVNEALISGGYVEARNYDNEFNYNSFVLYLSKTGGSYPESESGSSLVTIAVVGIIALAIALVVIGKVRR